MTSVLFKIDRSNILQVYFLNEYAYSVEMIANKCWQS